jgi:hypothetical protein
MLSLLERLADSLSSPGYLGCESFTASMVEYECRDSKGNNVVLYMIEGIKILYMVRGSSRFVSDNLRIDMRNMIVKCFERNAAFNFNEFDTKMEIKVSGITIPMTTSEENFPFLYANGEFRYDKYTLLYPEFFYP